VSAPRRGLMVPILIVALGLMVLIGLGTWQIERKAWKEALIATLTQRLDAEPQPLPPAARWAALERSAYEFARVKFRAEFLLGADPRKREARLYTGGSALRDDIKVPGYFVFASARLADGSVVVVNRGYVASVHPTSATPPAALPPAPVDVIGVIRFAERPGWFDQTYNAVDDLWFVRDHAAMAARNGWGAVAPFYVDMEASAPPGGIPRAGRITVKLRNDHLQYALTWYGLAAVLLIVFTVWVRGRRSPAKP